MRLRKWVKVILFIAFCLLIYFLIKNIFFKNNENKVINKKSKINYEELVSNKLKKENIDKEFISWVDKNYKGSLKKLNKLLDENEYNESYWHEVTGNSFIVLNDLYNNKYNEMDNVKILKNIKDATLSFVGDISLADNWYIMPKYDERGKKVLGILSKDVVDEMNNSTLMVANSEFTVSDRGTPIKGKTFTFKAKPERLNIYNEMGIDLLTLANNHVYDFGNDAFLDMLNAFNEYKLPHIGAGKNIEEAKKPYYFIINGYKIAFVNATRAEKNIFTPGATENSPGVFRCYDSTDMENLIKEIRKQSDYIITIIHFGKEGYHDLEPEQVRSAKAYIDAGSDVVIGHHAHTLQGIEFYKNKPIIYNLGDFIFNSSKEETAMFQIKLKEDGNMDYYIIPALQENCYTDFLQGEKKQKLINDIISWGINADIDVNGKITERK